MVTNLTSSVTFNRVTISLQIGDYFQSGGTSPDDFAVGLQNEFKPLEGHDIGEFPGLGSEKQIKKSHDMQLTT